MGKGMGPCQYIALMYLHSIVPRFEFYVYERWIYEHVMSMMYMKGWSMNLHSALVGLYKRVADIVMPTDSCIDIWTCVTLWVMWKVCLHLCIHSYTCIKI